MIVLFMVMMIGMLLFVLLSDIFLISVCMCPARIVRPMLAFSLPLCDV